FWINDVNAHTIADGAIVYYNASGGEVQQPLAKLEGLRLTVHPELGQAEQAMEAGRYQQAEAALRAVLQSPRQPWIGHYAAWRLIPVLVQQGKAGEAVEAYLRLVRGKADTHFLNQPPVEAVRTASAEQKRWVDQAVSGALPQADASVRPSLEALLE